MTLKQAFRMAVVIAESQKIAGGKGIMKTATAKAIMSVLMLYIMLITSFPSASYACSCANNPDPKTALEKAEAVFAGKVIAVKQERKQEGVVGAVEYRDANLFEVDKAWKGVNQSQIIIYDMGHDVSCGFVFEEGESYLVYVYKNKNGELYTSFCSRTVELSNAGQDLKLLGQGQEVDKQVNLEGEMKWVSNKDYDMEIFIGGIVIVLATALLIIKKVRSKG
jgi:hypothetical protein